MIQAKIVKVDKELPTPKYAHYGDAGMDLYAAEEYILKPGERKIFSTGLKIEIPEGYEVQIRPRSGLAAKNGVSIVNTPGTLDYQYRGIIGVILINHGIESFEVKKGERIAQMVFNKFESAELIEVEELSETVRGEGGFGSTGTKEIVKETVAKDGVIFGRKERAKSNTATVATMKEATELEAPEAPVEIKAQSETNLKKIHTTLKLFTQPTCSKCPAAKKMVAGIEDKLDVKYYDIKTEDGLAEALSYDVMATPSIIIIDGKNNILHEWRGEAPTIDELSKAIKL